MNNKWILSVTSLMILVCGFVISGCGRKPVPEADLADPATTSPEQITQAIAGHEQLSMNEALNAWDDPALIKKYSGADLSDEDVKRIYNRFLATVVTPPDPDSDTYEIEDGEKKLADTIALGKELHNRLKALHPSDAKYDLFIGMMSYVLLFDSLHIPLAIEGDRSRDVYWYETHNGAMEVVEEIHDLIFADE